MRMILAGAALAFSAGWRMAQEKVLLAGVLAVVGWAFIALAWVNIQKERR